MIPILYGETETQFTSNGFGGLKDAISCQVYEKINGEFELTMEYPVEGIHFEDIKKNRFIYAVPREGAQPEPFEIYRIGKELGGKVVVYAQHISYKLSLNPVKPFTATTPAEALLQVESKAVYPIGFTLAADTNKTGNYSLKVPKSARTVIGELLSKYKLEVEWSKDRILLKDRRGADNGVKVAYAKNLISASLDSSIADTVTGVLPYWTGFDASTNDTMLIMGDGVVLDQTHAGLYPYNRVITYDFANWFAEGHVPTTSELATAAAQYLANYQTGLADETTEFNFAPLWQTDEYKNRSAVERISIGDTVHVVSDNIKLDVTARVIEARWNVLKERYDSLIGGKAKNNISEQIQAVKDSILEDVPTKTDLQIAIEEATDQITGNNGGYIRFKYDANGKPTEFLIMDTDDETTATNVWRFNQSGFGHSSTGYNGPYTLAMTQDGKIVADFITTGTLNAGVIKTGLLRDAAGLNYWNMATGEFSLQSSVIESGLNQTNVFNALTNNGQTQGIYLQNGRVYINATYISTGALDADSLTLSGTLRIYRKSGSSTIWVGRLGGYQMPHNGNTVSVAGIFSPFLSGENPTSFVGVDSEDTGYIKGANIEIIGWNSDAGYGTINMYANYLDLSYVSRIICESDGSNCYTGSFPINSNAYRVYVRNGIITKILAQ